MRAFTIIDVPQRSEAWFKARLGRLTGSRAGDMLKTIKSGAFAASRRDYLLELALERVTGRVQEPGHVTADMQRGIELEGEARLVYMEQTGAGVVCSGFLSHNIYQAGCSLDGHVDDFAGIIEIKCPKSATHVEYLRTGSVPADYQAQILHGLWMTGAQWCDFISYDNRFPLKSRLLVRRVERNDAHIQIYEDAALKFLADVAAETLALREMVA